MPIRLPDMHLVRRQIAELAAEASGGSVDHFLSLIGPIEPMLPAPENDGAPWRLSAFYGSYAELDAISHAEQSVQRTCPRIEG